MINDSERRACGRTEDLERCDVGAEDENRARDEQDVLEDAREREHEPAARTDEEYGGDVEQKRDGRVREEDQRSVSRGRHQHQNRSYEHGGTAPREREPSDAPYTHDLVERREALGEGQNEEVDERADRCVVVQRHEGVHLETVEQNLDHHQTGRLKLRCQVGVRNFVTKNNGPPASGDGTYCDCGGLGEEADEIEPEFTLRRKCYTARDHEYDHAEFLVRILNPERPRDEEDGDGGECLWTRVSSSVATAFRASYLEHLNVGHTQVQIGSVTEDK